MAVEDLPPCGLAIQLNPENPVLGSCSYGIVNEYLLESCFLCPVCAARYEVRHILDLEMYKSTELSADTITESTPK